MTKLEKSVYDSSVKLFEINQSILHFVSISQDGDGNRECNARVTNLSNHYLAFRIKTTKKQEYAVNPTHCIIFPQSKVDINFSYSKKYPITDISTHKFLFDGFVINNAEKDIDPKVLFTKMIEAKNQFMGNEIKMGVVYDGIDQSNVNINQSQTSIFNSINIIDDIAKQEKPPVKEEKDSNEELENLKVEYYKMKNHLGILTQKYRNLKNRVDMEKAPESISVKPCM